MKIELKTVSPEFLFQSWRKQEIFLRGSFSVFHSYSFNRNHRFTKDSVHKFTYEFLCSFFHFLYMKHTKTFVVLVLKMNAHLYTTQHSLCVFEIENWVGEGSKSVFNRVHHEWSMGTMPEKNSLLLSESSLKGVEKRLNFH